jgi:hypothetical protein
MKLKGWSVIIVICISSIYGYTYTQHSNDTTKVIDTQQAKDSSALLSESVSTSLDMKCLLDAICQVESNCKADSTGDNGASIGAYQIQYNYWFDAVEWDPSLSSPIFKYTDCFNKEYSEFIIIAYMERYVPDAMEYFDPEIIARTHNGGPNGATKDSTIKYWKKVELIFNTRKYGLTPK